METVTFATVLEDAADLLGLDAENIAIAEFGRLSRGINRRARFAWDRFWWPDWTACEERSTSTATDSAIIIPAAATGKDTIGRVKRVWDANPYTNSQASVVASRRRDDGWFVNSSNATLWVEYRAIAPVWLGAVWSAGTYTTGDIVYYSGDFYKSNSNSNTDTPGTSKWDLVSFPRCLWMYSAVATAGDLRAKTEGQPEKLATWEREHLDLLLSEFDALEREENLVDDLPMRLPYAGL